MVKSERHGYVPDPRPWGHRSACSAGNEVRIEDCLKQGKGERESEMGGIGEQKVLHKLWLPGVKGKGEASAVGWPEGILRSETPNVQLEVFCLA